MGWRSDIHQEFFDRNKKFFTLSECGTKLIFQHENSHLTHKRARQFEPEDIIEIYESLAEARRKDGFRPAIFDVRSFYL